MAARTSKTAEALKAMEAASHAWSHAARKVLRYGDAFAMEELDEQVQWMLWIVDQRARERTGEGVQTRLQREQDRMVAKAVAEGRWDHELNADAED